MKISIGDLDYYHSTNKKDCFNPDAMKISSYHKQLGDKINFVVKEDDINRPYDIYYIIKNNEKTPNPPLNFYFDNRVKWWGKAFKSRINGRMSDQMLGCRPDYLLYPERDTKLERAEQIRLFNNKAEPLQGVQDGTNTYKKKDIIVTDPYMWCATKENLINALNKLAELEKVSFLEPIGIQKIISDQDIKNAFMKLHFKKGAILNWSTINMKQYDNAVEFLITFKKAFPNVGAHALIVDYRTKNKSHGDNKQNAMEDFSNLIRICEDAKFREYNIVIKMPQNRFETPYFELFEELAHGTKDNFTYSGLEHITFRYGKCSRVNMSNYWAHPEKWDEVFRDLLRQTYKEKNFIRHRGKEDYISVNDIPGNIGEKEFKYGI